MVAGVSIFFAGRHIAIGRDDHPYALAISGTFFIFSMGSYILHSLSSEDPPPQIDVTEAAMAQCGTASSEPRDACAICMEPINADFKVTPCGHHFHSACLRPWFARRPVCPLCMHSVFEAPLP